MTIHELQINLASIPLTTEWINASSVVPSAPILVEVADIIRIHVAFMHVGPSGQFHLYGAVGFGTTNTGTGSDSGQFQEGSPAGHSYFALDNDETPKEYSKLVDVVVPKRVWMPEAYYVGLDGRQAALYVKFPDLSLVLGQTLSSYLRGALNVSAQSGSFVYSDVAVLDYYKRV